MLPVVPHDLEHLERMIAPRRTVSNAGAWAATEGGGGGGGHSVAGPPC